MKLHQNQPGRDSTRTVLESSVRRSAGPLASQSQPLNPYKHEEKLST